MVDFYLIKKAMLTLANTSLAIEYMFHRVNIWVPTKDTGIDLLISDAKTGKWCLFK
jgi:hypothetical protein